MSFPSLLRYIAGVSTVLSLSLQGADAQYENMNTQELKTYALADYQLGNYSSALNKYSALVKRYPKDGLFHYYSGLCLLNMNTRIPAAIEYLNFSAARPNVPVDAWYYLAEAYMKNYQFPEARKYYLQFSDAADKSETVDKIPERKAEMALNATGNTRQSNSVDIISSSLFTFTDSAYLKQIKGVGGTLTIKPGELASSSETVDDLSGICFMPRNISKGDYVFYASYGKSKKKGTDLFRVKFLGGNRWSEPEAIKSLNTDYNEILPYFDPAGKDLYFASEGFSSIGNFDIFKSHYNQDNDTWSEPVNLGFPINSPSNEYVFLPGPDLGTVLLITDRHGLNKMNTVYVLRVREPKNSLSNASSEDLKRIGNFGGIESIPDIVDITEQGFNTRGRLQQDTVKRYSGPRPSLRKDVASSDEYNRQVTAALRYQYKADSLIRLAREARIRLKTIPDPDERWKTQTNIILWEKLSAENQAKADEYYLQVRNLEKGSAPDKNVPAVITRDTVINQIQTYRFTTVKKDSALKVKNAESPREKNAESPHEKVVQAVKTPAETVTGKLSPQAPGPNQFEILSKSPYSEKNPIPVDIPVPDGAFYRIQLGAFSQKVGFEAFKGCSPLTSETIPGKPMKRYYAGMFSSYERAKAALNEVRNRGFKDAFIASWYNGQKMTPEKVFEFEKRDSLKK